MKPTSEEQLQRMKDNVNKVLSDMVTLALHEYETTGKGLIIDEKSHGVCTPEFVVDMFEQHVRRIFDQEYQLPVHNSIAIFRLLTHNTKQELLYWDKPGSSIYVKKNP
jgi:hypothetical protein